MKRFLLLYITIFFTVLYCSSCKKQAKENACFSGDTYRKIDKQQATVIQANDDFYLVEDRSIDTRLKPCNLPENFRVNNLAVLISGEVKAIVQPGPGPGFTEPIVLSEIKQR